MGFGRSCCVSWSVKQGAIAVGTFTFLASIIWLGWETYQLILLNGIINDTDGACAPNPCLHGGVCLLSESNRNSLGYVCDCWGTGFDGLRCNASRIRSPAKRSCSDYWVEGYRTNGKYLIDPDGPDMRLRYFDIDVDNDGIISDETVEVPSPYRNSGLDPIVVYCEFTHNRAYTVFDAYDINEDGAGSSAIFNDPDDDNSKLQNLNFSYVHDSKDAFNSLGESVTGNIFSYMDALMKMSDDCEQRLTLECKKFALYDSTSSMYVQLQDGSYSDMAGNVYTELALLYQEFVCPCFLNDSCVPSEETESDKSVRCNCNLDDQSAQDELVLTKTEHGSRLPVQFVNFTFQLSGSSSDHELQYNLTGLKCYEEFEVTEQNSRYDNGGYGERGRRYFSQETRDGFCIMWGCFIAFAVVTGLLLITSVILLIAAWGDVPGAMIPWVLMIVLFNLMLFVIIIVRWFFLGFSDIIWEVGVAAVWLGLTFYGIFAVVAFFGDVKNGVVHD